MTNVESPVVTVLATDHPQGPVYKGERIRPGLVVIDYASPQSFGHTAAIFWRDPQESNWQYGGGQEETDTPESWVAIFPEFAPLFGDLSHRAPGDGLPAHSPASGRRFRTVAVPAATPTASIRASTLYPTTTSRC